MPGKERKSRKMPGCERGPQVTELVADAAWPRRAKVAQRNGKWVLQRKGEEKGIIAW